SRRQRTGSRPPFRISPPGWSASGALPWRKRPQRSLCSVRRRPSSAATALSGAPSTTPSFAIQLRSVPDLASASASLAVSSRQRPTTSALFDGVIALLVFAGTAIVLFVAGLWLGLRVVTPRLGRALDRREEDARTRDRDD